MSIPKQAEAVLGPGQTNGIPNDLAVGRNAFETNYSNSKGDLNQLQQNGASLSGALNTLNDPYTSITSKIEAAAALIALTVAAVTYASAQLALAGTLAAIAATIPVIGVILIACLAVIYAVVAAVGLATAGAPTQDTPEQRLALQINKIPTDLPLPSALNPPTLGAVQAMGILSDILAAESRGQSAADQRLALATLFNNQAGFAEDLYQITADVVLNPRWKLGPVKSFGMTSEQAIRQIQAQGARAFGLWSYEEVLESFRNTDLRRDESRREPGRFQPLPGASPSIRISATSATELAALPVIQRSQRGLWIVPRYFPGEPPNYDPYDVARYLVIFSVLYTLTDPRQARAATYTAVYLILLQKAWAFKAAGVAVPDDLYTTMGFMLDLVSQYPFVRVESSSRLNPFTGVQETVRQTVFRDVDFYVRHYLSLIPRVTEPIVSPDPSTVVTTQPGGAPKQPIPGTAPVRVSGASGGVIYPGNYLIEVDAMDPQWAVQKLKQSGIASQILTSGIPPNGGTRLVTQVSYPVKIQNFLPGFQWRLTRKLS